MDTLNIQTISAPQAQPINTMPSASSMPSQPAYLLPEKPKSKWKKILLIVGIIILLGFGVLGIFFFQGFKDAPEVKEKVTTFLQDVSSNNLEGAYSLTSSEFQKHTSREDFIKAMTFFKAQYSGFKEQNQTGFRIEANTLKPNLYRYTGEITYDDGDKGDLNATLIKENGEYKIQYINIVVDIKRGEKFQQNTPNSTLGASTKR